MEDQLDITFATGSGAEQSRDAVVYLIATNDEDERIEGSIPDGLHTEQLSDFDADSLESSVFYDGDFQADRLLLVGCGTESDLQGTDIAEVGGKITDLLSERDVADATIVIPHDLELDTERLTRELYLGIRLGHYEFDRYIHEEEDNDDEDDKDEVELETVELLLEDKRSKSPARVGFRRADSLAGGIELARDLGNTPSNDLVPYDLAEQAREIEAEQDNIDVTIWEQDDLVEDGMNLLNGVGKGSENPPCLILFDYDPGDTDETVAYAGKGVTFDSGGISIKPSKKMDEMKFDMGGSAAVFGILQAVSTLDLPVRVLGIVPSAENMPGQNAIKPGDVITGYAGKSVEILNTDAEGRLCLADALGYLCEQYGEQIDTLIDFATLTGACITALGHEAAGLMGNDDDLCEELMDIGQDVNEPVWQLPLWDDHTEQMDSSIADVKNLGGDAGAITAGAFLREFVDEDKINSWAHLDVAGTAWGMKELPYRPEGGTGFGVYLAVEFMRNHFSLD